MKEDPNQLPIDNGQDDLNVELEVRIVALVLGEASASEQEELERLVDQRADLQVFRKEIESVHGVLKDVGDGEWPSESESNAWRLPNDRRVKVLAQIVDPDPSVLTLASTSPSGVSMKRSWFWNQSTLRGLAKIAAVLCLAGFFGQMLLMEPMQMAGESARTHSSDGFSGKTVMSHRESAAETIGMSEAFGIELKSDLSLPVLDDSASMSRRQGLPNANATGQFPPQATNGLDLDMDGYGVVGGGGMGGTGMASGSSLDKEVSSLVDTFNYLMDVNRFEEAEVISEQIQELKPDSPIATSTFHASRTQPRIQMEQEIAASGEDGFASQMRGIARTAAVPDPDGPLSFPDPVSWEELSRRRLAAGDRSRPKDVKQLQSGDSRVSGRRSLGRRAKVLKQESSGLSAATGVIAPQSGPVAGKPLQANLFGNRGESSKLSESLVEQEPGGVALGIEVRDAERGFESGQSQFSGRIPTTKPETLERQVLDFKAQPKKEVAAAIRAVELGKLADAGEKWRMLESAKKKSAVPNFDVPADRGYAAYIKMPESKLQAGLDEKSAAQEAFSTFSLHVGDVAFKLAQSALAGGEWPEPAKVRIEEFVNALDYGDPLPSQSERVACRVEQAIHPFLQQRNLLRVSMRTAATGRASTTPLRLTCLLDNSGSMERMDRQETVRRAFALLAGQLQGIDQVTLISFARQPRLLADKVDGTRSSELVRVIQNLPSEGGTNLESALELAFEKAREQHTSEAQNRVVLLTDGAVNLGNANPESLSRLIETMRSQGIAFDAAGIGADGLNDEILEALTRKGDGRYYLLDSAEAADDGFARQIAGALRPAAMNVKVQVEFNPERVGQYKLLGFEKHRLAKEDFRNDKVDAAELAAAEAGVAVYQVEAKPNGEGDVGSVSVRFRDMSTGQMIENRWPIPYQSNALRLEQSTPSMRMAAAAALFAAKLRGDGLGQLVDLKSVAQFLSDLPDQGQSSERINQLKQMIQQARQLQGE